MSDDWVCEREYRIVVDGDVRPFMVRWMKPAPDALGDWSCRYDIEWPHEAHVRRRAFGVDSTQALYLAFQTAAAELHAVQPPVFWFDPGDVLGLPLASSIADLEADRAKGRS